MSYFPIFSNNGDSTDITLSGIRELLCESSKLSIKMNPSLILYASESIE